MLVAIDMIRKNALEVMADDRARASWKAHICAKDVLEALEEIAVLRAQVKTKDEQIAEMSALWKQIRKLEAA